MSNTTEAPFSLTFKMVSPEGADFLITSRPNITSAEEQIEFLQEIDNTVKELKAMGFTVQSSGYSKGGSSAAPKTVDPAAGTCNCGIPRVTKSGNGKRGPWTGYMCANRKCDPVWKE